MTAPNPSRRRWLTCFVPHRLDMLCSPAWQSMPNPLRKIVERLEVEHLSHGGQENGNLFVSFSQFEAAGVSRRQIKTLLDLGTKLGLIQVIQDADALPGAIRHPNAYRLTFCPAKGTKAPTDEWRSITRERATDLVAHFRAADCKTRKANDVEELNEASA